MTMKPGDPGRHTIKHERHYCEPCGRSITLNVDGTFRAHNLPRGGPASPNSARLWTPPTRPQPKIKPVVNLDAADRGDTDGDRNEGERT